MDVWTLFFLVPTVPAQAAAMLDAEEHERVFQWLHDYARRVPFHVRTIAAQHYRRVVVQREQDVSASVAGAAGEIVPPQWTYTRTGFSIQGRTDAAAPRIAVSRMATASASWATRAVSIRRASCRFGQATCLRRRRPRSAASRPSSASCATSPC